jgi:hypothetical protein
MRIWIATFPMTPRSAGAGRRPADRPPPLGHRTLGRRSGPALLDAGRRIKGGTDVPELAIKIGRIGKWEFDDYRP